MQLLDLIVRWSTEETVIVSHGVVVSFAIALLFKWKFFDKWQDYFKLNNICYFCFCFWLSIPFSEGLIDVIVATMISKTILNLNIGI